jgi:predicted regulator of Ras-like GTPase activity (Roadblock/LC7/MglB family)
MSSIAREIQEKMMYLLKDEESKTELENLAVLDRVGMKVATSSSSELDADATSASSTALIDLGLRLNQATDHGALTEIILHNSSGYSILMAINDEFIVFGGLRAVLRIGFYLGYLRDLARKLNKLISGDQETEMMLSLETSELEKIESQKMEEEALTLKKPSVEQDKAALDDLLGFLDDWEKEGETFEDLEAEAESNVVSIPKSIGLGIDHEVKELGETITPQVKETSMSKAQSQFQVYDDEVPPVALDDYTPMEIEEDSVTEEPSTVEVPTTYKESPPIEEFPSSENLPSLEELAPPDFEIESSASEYDTEFVLEEESETLGSVLRDLGWDQEDD